MLCSEIERDRIGILNNFGSCARYCAPDLGREQIGYFGLADSP